MLIDQCPTAPEGAGLCFGHYLVAGCRSLTGNGESLPTVRKKVAVNTQPSESLWEPPGELAERPGESLRAQATLPGPCWGLSTRQAILKALCVWTWQCVHAASAGFGAKRLGGALCMHKCIDFCSGCAVRAALTPAPFPPRAALSSLELLCKGKACLERYLALIHKVWGCGWAWPPFFLPILHDPPLLLLLPLLSFPNTYWNSEAATTSEPMKCDLSVSWVWGALCYK